MSSEEIVGDARDDLLGRMLGDIRADRLIRLLADAARMPWPIVVLPGAAPPRASGRGYYYTTPSGQTEIRYPNAYGWPMTYHHSTKRIEVGAEWIEHQVRRGWREDDHDGGLRTYVDCASTRTIHRYRVEFAVSAKGRKLWMITCPDERTYHADRWGADQPRDGVRRALTDLRCLRTLDRADRELLAGLRALPSISITPWDVVAAGACLPSVKAWLARAGVPGATSEASEDVLTAALVLGGVDYVRRAITRAGGV